MAASTRQQGQKSGTIIDANNRLATEHVEQVVSVIQDEDTKNVIKNYQGVMGKPGVDFPVLTFIPRTTFTCRGLKSGYYADLDTNCQVFHICDEGRKVSFLCPNGTIFQQSDLICDWWFKVDCTNSPALYSTSAEQLQEDNLRKKETRRAQQAKKIEDMQHTLNDALNKRSRENPSHEVLNKETFNLRRPTNRRNELTKKDINDYVSNVGSNENRFQKSNSKVYKETQVLAETASFVSRKFIDQQNYFKNPNDIRLSKLTYLPQRTHADNREPSTEKSNRTVKTHESILSTARPYRGRNNEYLKTTTQHTIYSPTVPPYTASKYTTRIPLTRPISSTTEFLRTKPTTSPNTTTFLIPTTINTPETTTSTRTSTTTSTKASYPTGFFITRVADIPTRVPRISSESSTGTQVKTLHVNKEETTYPSEIKENSTLNSEIETLTQVNTSKPLVTRALESSYGSYNFADKDDILTTNSNKSTDSTTPYSTVLTTSSFATVDTSYIDLPSTDNSKYIIPNEKTNASKFNQYTYLPKYSEGNISTVKPTTPTPYTTYTTLASVTDNLNNMIKTLHNLDSVNPSMDIEKFLNSRPGLNIPPSAGPNTLHSLAVYFATALDNLVSTNETYKEIEKITTENPPSTVTDEDQFVSLLSRSTVDKYNSLFSENHTEDKSQEDTSDNEPLNIKSLVEHDIHLNDLDTQHSQNPFSSTPRIRQLAQVFTQALSAYLDDPDTFKRVLEEIRPTEPPQLENTNYEFTEKPFTITTVSHEFSSYTKEEDEVLDFSDIDKASVYPSSSTTPISPTTTDHQTTITTKQTYTTDNEISTPLPEEITNSPYGLNTLRDSRAQTLNKLAIDLNNNLPYTSTIKQETTTQSNYLQVDEYDKEKQNKKNNAIPYDFSTTVTETLKDITTENWNTEEIVTNYNILNKNLSESQPFDALLPPYNNSQHISTTNNSNSNEFLQNAQSQSFISHENNIVTNDRKAKSLYNSDVTEDSISTTNLYTRETTTDFRNIETSTIDIFKYETTTTNPLKNEILTTELLNDAHTTTDYNLYTFETSTEYPHESSTPSTVTISTTINADTTTLPYTSTYGYIASEYTTTDKQTTKDITTEFPSTQISTSDSYWDTTPKVTKLWETTLFVNPLLINSLNEKLDLNTNVETDISSTTETYIHSTQETPYKTTTDTDIFKHTTTTTEQYDSTTEELKSELFSYSPYADNINNLINSTELEIASSQANQLFGNLDISEQDLLMEKMKMAESNSTVRRLILLLVSTCDASLNHNKTVQETRNYILHALLGIPINSSEPDDKQKPPKHDSENSNISKEQIKSRVGKALNNADVQNVSSIPETSTTVNIVTSSRSYIITEKKPTVSKTRAPNKVVNIQNVHQNTRALELLRSLYSLAAKWSKK